MARPTSSNVWPNAGAAATTPQPIRQAVAAAIVGALLRQDLIFKTIGHNCSP